MKSFRNPFYLLVIFLLPIQILFSQDDSSIHQRVLTEILRNKNQISQSEYKSRVENAMKPYLDLAQHFDKKWRQETMNLKIQERKLNGPKIVPPATKVYHSHEGVRVTSLTENCLPRRIRSASKLAILKCLGLMGLLKGMLVRIQRVDESGLSEKIKDANWFVPTPAWTLTYQIAILGAPFPMQFQIEINENGKILNFPEIPILNETSFSVIPISEIIPKVIKDIASDPLELSEISFLYSTQFRSLVYQLLVDKTKGDPYGGLFSKFQVDAKSGKILGVFSGVDKIL